MEELCLCQNKKMRAQEKPKLFQSCISIKGRRRQRRENEQKPQHLANKYADVVVLNLPEKFSKKLEKTLDGGGKDC